MSAPNFIKQCRNLYETKFGSYNAACETLGELCEALLILWEKGYSPKDAVKWCDENDK